MIDLPEKFKERMKSQLKGDYDAFLASYNEPPKKGLRVNTLRISADDFLRKAPALWQLEPTALNRDGFLIGSAEGEKAAGRHPYHAAGVYYLQEPSAMSVAEQLRNYPFDETTKVLDLCAAPGGKIGAVAALMQGRGVIVSNEIVRKRADELTKNTERLGITNAVVTNLSPDRVAECFPCCFDIVLVDAPCSGEGMFRKNPLACGEWSPEHVKSCAIRQRLILQDAAKCVKGGGLLIYSTCTFSEEENEQIVEWFTREYDYSILHMQRLYPHLSDGEGHFLCIMRNKNEEAIKGRSIKKQQKPQYKPCKSKTFSEFSEDTFAELPDLPVHMTDSGIIVLANDEVIRAAESIPHICAGVFAGYDKGKYFDPSHTLFMAATNGKYRLQADFAPDSEMLLAFMRGEEIEGEGKGYCIITVDGFPIGFSKISNGVMKNKYPKGLRI